MSRRQRLGIILTPRDLLLLRILVTTRILDAEEVKTVTGFNSIRRTNRRLLKLVKAGLLRRWFLGTECGGKRAVYGLSPIAAAKVGEGSAGLGTWKQDSLITSSLFLDHLRGVNEIFIETHYRPRQETFECQNWKVFRIPISPSVPLVPDAYFEIVGTGGIHPMFLEVDLGTEPSSVWMRKAELYLTLATNGEFERLFQQKRFRVLVVFHSERRLATVRRTIATRTDKLFWFSTRQRVKDSGFWNSGWVRPRREEMRTLL